MTGAERPAHLAPEIEPIVLAVLEQRVKDAKAAARVPLEPLYSDGEKRVIRSPLDDRKLGVVYRTDPDAKWTVVDRAALTRHLADDPANIEYVDDIAGSDDQVIAVLREHAPELLAQIERVTSQAFDAALRAATTGAAVPGIERVKPRGSLAVRPDKAAGVAIEALIAARWISYDGRALELPAGASAEPPPPVQTPAVCRGCGEVIPDDAGWVYVETDDEDLVAAWHLACAPEREASA